MKNTFKWLNWTQFTGALNDNAFKMTAIIALVNQLGPKSLPTVVATCAALFVVPFLLFSNFAGTLADRFSKRRIIIASKLLEVGTLLLAIPAMLSGLSWPLYALLFLLCSQSALFGPAKRGIVPELVDNSELSRANGFLTAATYTAVILGTFLPTLLLGIFKLNSLIVIGTLLCLALSGLIASFRIARVPANGTRRNASPWIIPDVISAVKNLRTDRWLKLAAYGLILFSGIAALFQQSLVLFGTDALGLSVENSALLFPLAAAGIGIGALLTGRFSKHSIEIGLIPFGAVSLMISCIGLSLAHSPIVIGFWIVAIGASCGFYLVPINAFIQQRVPAERRGELFGATSFLGFSTAVLASALFYLLTSVLGASARTCFLVCGIIGSVPAIIACLRLPEFLARFVFARITHRLYRINTTGLDNLPREGGALLIANHISYTDALLLQASTQRPIRFLMSREMFQKLQFWQPVLKLTNIIQIHTTDGPRALVESLKTARAELDKGNLVCIFPEGALTLNGNLQEFHKGFERIVKGSNYPIIPAHLGNVWGSIFSFKEGPFTWRKPPQFPRPISIRFGNALQTNTTADEARLAIEELAAEYATEKAHRADQTLPEQFIKKARANWHKKSLSDTLGRNASYGKLLTGATALIRQTRTLTADQQHIGILCPCSVGGAVANLSVTLQGKTAVNLNWTASSDSLKTAIKETGIQYVITSHRFAQKIERPRLPVQWLYLEDLLINLSLREQAGIWFRARFANLIWFTNGRTVKPNDTATVIFSSGSTGTPKGIELSHANILANCDGCSQVIDLDRNESICGVLPFFHAFGYMGTFWWPLLSGARVAYHPNPLQPAAVIKLIKSEKLSVLMATPTFLQAYMRRAKVEDFSSLKTVITGGEKLPAKLAQHFAEKFAIQPQEGYGCTELSPVAALSLPNGNFAEREYTGSKAGSTGHPLPGIAARIVDPETRAPMPLGQDGLLLIKGPNVMKGYLNQPTKTAEVLQDGWYNTGDIAHLDSDGFIFLTDRLSRFSKIGGEMVPHGAIEEALHEISNSDEPCVAVVSINDEAKGEQLAVCLTDAAGDPQTLIEKLRERGLPNLWIPRAANFIRIPELPLLGSGKLDLCTLKQLARQS
jgi:acyl-[acyl-carrier-protein]-phospholipid O-acyltransferase/long-chain-fatty-acid--[acyl-carrier-protein] ligase